MKVLKTKNRTFNKTVKKLIAANLKNVISYQEVDRRCVRLLGEEGNTIALWLQIESGSEITINSWYND